MPAQRRLARAPRSIRGASDTGHAQGRDESHRLAARHFFGLKSECVAEDRLTDLRLKASCSRCLSVPPRLRGGCCLLTALIRSPASSVSPCYHSSNQLCPWTFT